MQRVSRISLVNSFFELKFFLLCNFFLCNSFCHKYLGPLGHRNKIMRELKNTKDKESDVDFPDEFLCPITRELMSDPVIAAGERCF